LRNIAIAIVRIDAWVLENIKESYYATPQLASQGVVDEFNDIISEDIRLLSNKHYTASIYEADFKQMFGGP